MLDKFLTNLLHGCFVHLTRLSSCNGGFHIETQVCTRVRDPKQHFDFNVSLRDWRIFYLLLLILETEEFV